MKFIFDESVKKQAKEGAKQGDNGLAAKSKHGRKRKVIEDVPLDETHLM